MAKRAIGFRPLEVRSAGRGRPVQDRSHRRPDRGTSPSAGSGAALGPPIVRQPQARPTGFRPGCAAPSEGRRRGVIGDGGRHWPRPPSLAPRHRLFAPRAPDVAGGEFGELGDVSGPDVGPAVALATDEVRDPRRDDRRTNEEILSEETGRDHRIMASQEFHTACLERDQFIRELGAHTQRGYRRPVEDDLHRHRVLSHVVEQVSCVSESQALALRARVVDVNYDAHRVVVRVGHACRC